MSLIMPLVLSEMEINELDHLDYDRVQHVRLRSEGFLRELGLNDIYIGLVRDWCE